MSDTTKTASIPETEITNTSEPPNPHQHKSQPNKAASEALFKNWRTTAIGVILSFTGFVAFSPSTFGGEQATFVQFCKYITSGGLAALGVYSKDFNGPNGSKEQ